MQRWRYVAVVFFIFLLSDYGFSAEPAVSWLGPVGLFTQPSANTFRKGEAALTFSELRFMQDNNDSCVKTTSISGSFTVVPVDRLELAISTRHEMIQTFPMYGADLLHDISVSEIIGDIKYVVIPVEPCKPGLAVGIIDLTNATDVIAGHDTERGRRFYLAGTYEWATLGVTHDGQGIQGYVGVDFTINTNIEFIYEYSTAPIFPRALPHPSTDVNCNMGLRIHPCEIPNLRLDLAAVGDGHFCFGFSFSQKFSLF